MESFKYTNSFYNPRLQANARILRKKMTKAEAALWKYALRGRAMKGYSFRRERPVLKYIADFMCQKLMLVIEIDGATHFLDEVIKKDIKKQSNLESAGFKVLRFADNDVLTNIKGVITVIEDTIEEQEKKLGVQQPPPPAPASGG